MTKTEAAAQFIQRKSQPDGGTFSVYTQPLAMPMVIPSMKQLRNSRKITKIGIITTWLLRLTYRNYCRKAQQGIQTDGMLEFIRTLENQHGP